MVSKKKLAKNFLVFALTFCMLFSAVQPTLSVKAEGETEEYADAENDVADEGDEAAADEEAEEEEEADAEDPEEEEAEATDQNTEEFEDAENSDFGYEDGVDQQTEELSNEKQGAQDEGSEKQEDVTETSDNETSDDESVNVCEHGNEAESCAICAVQALIDALPSVEELSSMSLDEQNAVCTDTQAANDAWAALPAEEQAEVDDSRLDELFEYFSNGISVAADEDDETSYVAMIGDVSYATVTAALEAVADSTETTITMVADSQENITISADQVIILDLNGHTLTGTGSGSVIINYGTLTIQDNGTSGTITGGSATDKSSTAMTQGGGVYSTGSLTLAGGTISGNTARNGGGIYVTSAGSFTMTGGSVSNNTAKRLSGDTVYVASNGGGISTSCATTITGGTIANNSASGYGGGFYSNSASGTINGSDGNPVIISGNTAGTSGAGVYLGSGTFSITNANITKNTLTGTTTNNYFAAGLSINSPSATLELSNVTISGNSSSSAAAGGLGINAKIFSATNCSITSNTSTSGVGGICIYEAGNANEKEYKLTGCQISGNTGGTAGALSVEESTSTKYSYNGVILSSTIITGNTGVTVGGVSGAINMSDGALYGNASSDGNAANDWLVSMTSVTSTSLSPAVYVLAASEMSASGVSFDNYLWIDVQNALKLNSALNSETLGDEDASTFYFTAREMSYVAEITVGETTTQYETITEAVAAAIEMDGDVTIKLIADEASGYTITEDVTIPENESVTIDLNGCTINTKSADYAFKVSSGASLTLTGTGTVAGIDDQGSSLSILGDIEVGTVVLAEDAVIMASDDFAPESLTIVLADSVLKALNDASDTTDIVTLVQPAEGEELSDALVSAITVSGANVLVVVSKNDDGNIVAGITDLNGIFVDGVNGDDETGDGTYNNPVKTFAKAKELLKAALEEEADCDGIYVMNTITVTDTEEWSLDDLTETAGEVSLMRLPTFTGILVTVGDGGSLTLSDITIDGQSYEVDSCLVQVNGDGAELTIEGGAVIQNNYNTTSGAISETEAAVTVVNGTLTMNGGTITGNTGNWGGGIALVANDDSKEAVMYFNGGTVSNNMADAGGGIFLYGNATLYMNGGYIDSNTAYSRGGGFAVWSGSDAYVYGGYITNNQQITDSGTGEISYGGGGIYVNDSSGSFGYGTLYLYNVEITNNSHVSSVSTFNGYYDGTIAACNTSYVEINVTDGAVIHDNYANYRNDITLYSDTYQENFYLSPVMLGGGAYNWVDRGGNAVDVTDLSQYRSVANGLAFRSTATEITGLDRVTTYISGNSAIRAGAAIAANGNLIIGRDDGTVTLNIEKVWSNAFAEDSIPESIEVELYATDSKGVTADLGTLTLSAENNWTVTVTDLPKYDSYYDSETQASTTYTYTVEEISEGDYITFIHCSEVDDGDDDASTAEYSITVNNLPETELTIRKTVVGESSAESYTFLLYVGEKEDVPYTGQLSGVDSDGNSRTFSFWLGYTNITLAADESVTITLGAGMYYAVQETDSKGAYKVTYTVDEDDGTGTVASGTLTTEGATVVFENNFETITVSGTKIWDDANDQDGKRPESITVNLLANGKIINSQTVTADEDWTYTFIDLPKYSDGVKIAYSITEEAVDNYSATYDGYDITNSYTPGQTSVTVSKSWEDSDDQDGLRPTSVTVSLLKNGSATGQTVMLSASNNWTASFTNLDQYTDGVENVYTVAEASVPSGYTAAVKGDMTTGFVITNTHTVTTTESEDPGDDSDTTEDTTEDITETETTETEEAVSEVIAEVVSAVTGDNAPIGIAILFAAVSEISLLILIFLQMRKKKEEV